MIVLEISLRNYDDFYNEGISIKVEGFFKVLFILCGMFFKHFREDYLESKKDCWKWVEI
jgi:hypothetical protein